MINSVAVVKRRWDVVYTLLSKTYGNETAAFNLQHFIFLKCVTLTKGWFPDKLVHTSAKWFSKEFFCQHPNKWHHFTAWTLIGLILPSLIVGEGWGGFLWITQSFDVIFVVWCYVDTSGPSLSLQPCPNQGGYFYSPWSESVLQS